MAKSRQKQGAVFFILITVFIDSLGIGLIIPVMPSLIQSLGSGSIGDAASWGGILSTVFALMQFIFGPILGSLSDAYGRRPVLLVSLAVMSANYLLMGLAGSIFMLLIARIIGGMASATISAASAYIADISTPEEKTKNFGLISASFGAGFIFGPVVGGFLGEISPQAPFFGAAILAALNLAYGYFVLPESLPPEKRRPFTLKRANPISAIRSVAEFPLLRRVLIVMLIYGIAFNVFQSVWAYYGELRYDWTPRTLGLSLAFFGVATVIVQALLVSPTIKALGEKRTIMLAFAVDIVIFTVIAFISDGNIAIIVGPISSVGAMAQPALQGVMSRNTADDQQGVLQGVISSIRSLSMIIAPLVMTQVFAYFSKPDTSYFFPGAPFILSAILLVICVVIVWRTKPEMVQSHQAAHKKMPAQ